MRGWELVVSGVAREVLDGMAPQLGTITPLGSDRYTLELPPSSPPEDVLSALVARGASLVSLNPIRDTLEDVFVQHVTTAGPARLVERSS